MISTFGGEQIASVSKSFAHFWPKGFPPVLFFFGGIETTSHFLLKILAWWASRCWLSQELEPGLCFRYPGRLNPGLQTCCLYSDSLCKLTFKVPTIDMYYVCVYIYIGIWSIVLVNWVYNPVYIWGVLFVIKHHLIFFRIPIHWMVQPHPIDNRLSSVKYINLYPHMFGPLNQPPGL